MQLCRFALWTNQSFSSSGFPVQSLFESWRVEDVVKKPKTMVCSCQTFFWLVSSWIYTSVCRRFLRKNDERSILVRTQRVWQTLWRSHPAEPGRCEEIGNLSPSLWSLQSMHCNHKKMAGRALVAHSVSDMQTISPTSWYAVASSETWVRMIIPYRGKVLQKTESFGDWRGVTSDTDVKPWSCSKSLLFHIFLICLFSSNSGLFNHFIDALLFQRFLMNRVSVFFAIHRLCNIVNARKGMLCILGRSYHSL